MITVESPIIGNGGTRHEVNITGANRLSDVADYAFELERLCPLVGFDYRILFAQAWHETAGFTSHWWSSRLNPAGIGVTGNPAQNEASHTWATGTEAARAHVTHMALYVYGDWDEMIMLSFRAPTAGEPWVTLDRELGDATDYFRYPDILAAGYLRSVTVLGDLGNGRWAVDKDYAVKIASVANKIFKEEPPVPEQSVVFGRVPMPAMVPDMICKKPFEGAGFYRVAPRQNVGICEHITDGEGSVEFYHQFFSTGGERATDALVDFIVGRDGRIAMLNDFRGTRAPWANGNKLGMEGDGPAFYQRFGVEGIDQRLVSIEHEGTATEDWPGAMWNAAVALDAWLFDQMGVRYDSFPVHQDFGVVTHLLHSEFTNKGGNSLDECPGRYLKQNISAYQSDIKAVMMAHQIVSDPVPPDPPKPPIDTTPKPFPGFAHGLKTGTDQHVGNVTYQYLNRLFTVVAGRKAQVRVSPSKEAMIIRVMQAGEKVRSAFVVHLPFTKLDWMITDKGEAVQLNAVTPKVALPLKPRR